MILNLWYKMTKLKSTCSDVPRTCIHQSTSFERQVNISHLGDTFLSLLLSLHSYSLPQRPFLAHFLYFLPLPQPQGSLGFNFLALFFVGPSPAPAPFTSGSNTPGSANTKNSWSETFADTGFRLAFTWSSLPFLKVS